MLLLFEFQYAQNFQISLLPLHKTAPFIAAATTRFENLKILNLVVAAA